MDVFHTINVGEWIKFKTVDSNFEEIGYVLEIIDEPSPTFIIWERAQELDTTNNAYPWDFAHLSLRNAKFNFVWIKRELEVENLEMLEVHAWDDPPLDPTKLLESPSHIFRVCGDRNVTYGDGGSSDLIYPIWYCVEPHVDDKIRSGLLESLLKLNEIRKDYQEGTPVEDIIDPDLGPLRITSNYLDRKRAELVRGNDQRELREFNRDAPYLKLSEMVKIRESYHWIPSIFHINNEESVSIKSRIHNLPPKLSNASTYSRIAKIFEGMLPMFQKLHIAKPNTDVQVIVKAQSYRLLPGMTYKGRWHVEGQTENIVAVGVYYLQVDEGLEGGRLKFRPADSPQPWYEIKTDIELDVKQGNAVVFSNIIPHRFRKISNNSNVEKRRTFLNFFIVDPLRPLTSTKQVPTTSLIVNALTTTANKYGIILPKPILKHILTYMPNVWAGSSEAKKFRKCARESMKSEKSGWGWINWGNCGTVEFVPAYSVWSSRKQDECKELQNTDSDGPNGNHG